MVGRFGFRLTNSEGMHANGYPHASGAVYNLSDIWYDRGSLDGLNAVLSVVAHCSLRNSRLSLVGAGEAGLVRTHSTKPAAE